MSFAISAEGIKASAAGSDVTTDAANTTGANLIVLAVAYYHAGTASIPTVLDSKGNTWTALSDRRSSNQGCRLFYCAGPTVGTSHTFATSGANFPVLGYFAVSGASATPLHSENGNATESGTSLQPGSVTPPVVGCLLITGLNFAGGSGAAIGSGFTAGTSSYNPGVAIAGGIARLIWPAATAVNPTWSWTGTGEGAAGIAVFQPAASGPTLSARTAPSAGTTLTATLSQSGCLPTSGTGGFTLAGTHATVTSWAISGTTLTLTLARKVYRGQVVTLSYSRAATSDDIADAASNFLADFSGAAVVNNSTQRRPVLILGVG